MYKYVVAIFKEVQGGTGGYNTCVKVSYSTFRADKKKIMRYIKIQKNKQNGWQFASKWSDLVFQIFFATTYLQASEG